MVNIGIGGKGIEKFSVYRNGGECIDYAANQLCAYVKRAGGTSLDVTGERKRGQIVLGTDDRKEKDGFTIACRDGELFITGGSERGVLYGVYAFLEKFVGWRFLAAESCYRGQETGAYLAPVEKLFPPEATEINEGYDYTTAPVIKFRDLFGHATVHEDWCAKNRINGDIWKLKTTPAYMGGAETFATDGGHSFDRLIPEDEYMPTHPEYFALVDGKRTGGPMSQLCLTADGLAEEVARRVIEIADAHPEAKYISVSQNDNENFCQCDKCRAEEAHIGRGNLLFGFVNKVARIVGKERPDVKIHTYAYESTIGDNPVKLEPNVLLQFCLRYCHCHAIDDPDCAANARVVKRIKKASATCSEMFIYDYRSSEAYVPMLLPNIFKLRDDMRFLADIGVSGMYGETDIFCQNSPATEELRDYVTARLMWDPYMSENEFNRHINEFLEGYYGKGWKHIRRFLEIYEKESSHSHIDSVSSANVLDNAQGWFEDGKNVRCVTIPRERIEEVIPTLEAELSAAYELSLDGGAADKSETCPRIKMLYAFTTWYRLYHTMEKIMESGTEEEKKKAVADNRKLCSIMRRYCMKYTVFTAMTETTEMFRDFTLPPSKWKYWGAQCQFNKIF